jgi:signal transduction histidine kinase
VTVAGAFAVRATVLVRSRPEKMMGWWFVGAEVTLAVALVVLDGLVFGPGHVWSTSQNLSTQWPLLAAASVGVAKGPWTGAVCGALMGPARWAAAVVNGVHRFGAAEVVSLLGASILFAAFWAVIGWWSLLLRRAEDEIADRRARDEVARVLHDTVLQTLALVERRTADSDPELATAARDTDRRLRAYLFGSTVPERGSLDGRIRSVVERVRVGHATPVTINVLDDGDLEAREQDLLARAVGEAVANALEHASAERIVVFGDLDDDGALLVTIRDDGVGFDPVAARVGHGLNESVEGRLLAIGGTVSIRSTPGRGTEVALRTRPRARRSRS